MPSTYSPIATTTLSSAASTITFSSIPNTYTDLRLTIVATSSASNIYINFNSDTGSNYSVTRIDGDGSAASSVAQSNLSEARLYGLNSSTPTFYTMDIFSYAGSTNKTFLAESNGDLNGSGFVRRYVELWRNTAAINTILLTASGGTFSTNTTATLYGIKSA